MCALCCCVYAAAAERAKGFDEALSKAGSDGVAVYCYGPDWNPRSVRLLQSFWNTPAAEEAACNAVMVAVPFYENSSSPAAQKDSGIRGSMSAPRFQVCPTVLLFTKEGHLYATLQGNDYLGNDAKCSLGLKNMRDKIHALREFQKLMQEADAEEKTAKKLELLGKAADLPIDVPREVIDRITAADPQDKAGYHRRITFNARAFMYELMETKDGFLKPDFEPDMQKIRKECEAIFKIKNIRPRDKQAVYNLYIGQSRREHVQGNKLRGMIRKSQKVDEHTDYGRLSPNLMKLWGSLKHRPTPENRRKNAAAKREKARQERSKKRAERNIEIHK